MAALAHTVARVSGFSFAQKLMDSFWSKLERRNVPHWVEYLNTK